MSTKRNDLSLSKKIEVLEEINFKKSQSEIANKFGISQTQVSRIKKNGESIRKEYASNGSLSRKRKRKSNFDDVDQAMLDWFQAKRAKGALINGAMIQQKAMEISKNFENCEKFIASNGWLYRWQQRNNLSFKIGHGESGSTDDSTCEIWREKTLVPLLQEYGAENIFNCDETALFYRAMPSGTLAKRGEKVPGYKKNKDRVTLLFCANQAETEKLEPLMIGKSKQPRCLKGIQKCPIPYMHSRNAWMTRNIFRKWLVDLDLDFKRRNKKVVLFLDNVSSHKIDSLRLTNIILQFLPANATCKIQPLDQGIIRSFKARYRKQVIQEVLRFLEEATPEESLLSVYKKINLLTAMHFVKRVWDSVPMEVVKNCFKKAQFFPPEEIRDDETVQSSTT
nr:tigger transposable element-derived protein 6-like [Parasteatoda tepidariorum]